MTLNTILVFALVGAAVLAVMAAFGGTAGAGSGIDEDSSAASGDSGGGDGGGGGD